MEKTSLTDLEVIEIFQANGRTRRLAAKYEVSAGTVTAIKGGWHPYERIIHDYKFKALMHIRKGKFGYDPDYKIFEKLKNVFQKAG